MIEAEQYLQAGDIKLRAKDIKILLEEHDNMKQDIKRLKEEYMILQNASDEVEEDKDKEIERLTAESTKWESKFYDEAKKVDKAIEYLESYNTDFKNCRFGEAPISIRELGDLLDILKGVDKE